MMENYTYSITEDTLNGKLNPSGLRKEIENNSSITISIFDVGDSGDTINISFKAELSEAELVILEDIVNLHDGVPNIQEDFIVIINEEGRDKKYTTGGHFKAETWTFDVPASAGIHTKDFSYPFNVAMLAFEHVGQADQVGDTFNIFVGPNTIVGAITSDVSISDTVINVTPSVVENVYQGMRVQLGGVDYGYITNVNTVLNQITIQEPADQEFLAVTPTYVSFTAEALKNIEIVETTSSSQYGGSKIGGSPVPAGTIMRIEYNNKDGLAKRFVSTVEYLY